MASSGLELGAQRLERGHVDLGEGGERLDDVAQHVERDAGADGQGGLLQPLTRLRDPGRRRRSAARRRTAAS